MTTLTPLTVTVTAVARRLGHDRATLLRWEASGKLASIYGLRRINSAGEPPLFRTVDVDQAVTRLTAPAVA